MKKTVLMVAALLCTFACIAQVVDFEDLTLEPNSSWIGADGTGQFTSSYLTLYNDYSAGSWQGFAYTNGTDAETNSYSNLSSCVGHGAGNSAYYVTAYIGLDWMGGTYDPIPVGMKINTANSGNFANRGAYFCMPVLLKKWVDREYASNHFYFKLKASAYANGALIGDSEIMMADFTEGNSYMMDDWTYVDLSWIENADSLNFIAISNDTAGGWGINTPMYFCMDDFGAQNPYPAVVDFEEFELAPNTAWTGVPGPDDGDGSPFTSSYLTFYNMNVEDWSYWEGFAYTNGTDTETFGFTNNSAIVGHGNANSEYYVTCYMGGFLNKSSIKIDTEHSGSFENRGAYFCLPTYVSKYVDDVEDAHSDFAGRHSYFSVKVTAYADGTEVANREIVMADFREDRTYKMDDWTFVDFSWIANADSLFFEALSNDGATPYYFCMDDFGAQDPNYINYTEIVHFEELELEPNTYWYSHEETGTFQSSYLTFYSHYDEDWGPYWEGFAYTNGTDVNTYGYSNLSAIAGSGNGNSENYATCYMGWYEMAGLKIDTEHSGDFTNRGAYFCLPTYVSKYIDDENVSFAENHFYYSVKITAYAGEDEVASREIVMADFREDKTYKMDEWTLVDLSWIANADSLFFEAVGNDTAGGWGINTPTYFCMDDFGAPAFTITATAGEGGSINPAEVTVEEGENAEFTITANEGFRIVSVIVDATTENETNVTEQLVEGVYTFTNVTANHTIAATFEAIPVPTYTITVNAGENGTVKYNDEEVTAPVVVNEGATPAFVITPAENYQIGTLTVDEEEITLTTEELAGYTYTFAAVNANHTLTVTFVETVAVDMIDAGSMSIYPNPNNGMFSIDFNNIEGDATYQLIDARGTIVETRDINVMSGETMNFNHNINAGTYFVRIISGDIVYVEQIVIE